MVGGMIGIVFQRPGQDKLDHALQQRPTAQELVKDGILEGEPGSVLAANDNVDDVGAEKEMPAP